MFADDTFFLSDYCYKRFIINANKKQKNDNCFTANKLLQNINKTSVGQVNEKR